MTIRSDFFDGAMSQMDGHINASSVDLPVDGKLPGLADMLDIRRFREIIELAVGGFRGHIRNSHITYIRYKPATNCLIAYMLTLERLSEEIPENILLYAKLYTANDYENALGKIGKFHMQRSSAVPAAVPLPEQRAILYFYPNDCLIDGLKVLSSNKKIQRLLYRHYERFPEDNWRISDTKMRLSLLRYKPERRAVLRCDTTAIRRDSGEKQRLSVFIRAYGDMRGREIFTIQRKLYKLAQSGQTFSVPMPILYLPDRRLFFMETVEGRGFLEALDSDKSILTRVADSMAELHNTGDSDFPKRTLDSLLGDALETSIVIGQIAPEHAGPALEIFDALKSYAKNHGPARIGFVHGDFYYGQVIVQKERIVFLDFDRSYFGDPFADIGNFCAHLRYLGIEGKLENWASLERAFIEAYQDNIGEKPDYNHLRFHLAYGLFQLSVGPFRRLEFGWKQKIKAVLDECRNILRE